jgi:hypothetical protein
VRDLSIAVWRLFTDLDLSDAKKSEFRSLHDCFTRELREGCASGRPGSRQCCAAPATASSAPVRPGDRRPAVPGQGVSLLRSKSCSAATRWQRSTADGTYVTLAPHLERCTTASTRPRP